MFQFSQGYAGIITAALSGFLLTFILMANPPKFLPRDQGRAFAINGEKSKGKVRGVGILFILIYCIVALLFLPITLEFCGYLVLLFLSMLFGYLDDASAIPWKDYLKGALDLAISVAAMLIFLHYNNTEIRIFNLSFTLHPVIYFVLGIVLIWVSVNVVNCTDGVDGLCGSLSLISLMSFALLVYSITGRAPDSTLGGDQGGLLYAGACLLFIGVLLSYLWYNLSPSTLLMGDAGSRAIGFFLAIIAMKSDHPLAFIPFCIVMILDGGLGLVKLFLLRFLKISIFKNTRMPLHDHFRKTLQWSDPQVVGRYMILQGLMCAGTLALLYQYL